MRRVGDRPWNDPVPRSAEKFELPTLKAVIYDFSAVSNVDVTSCQVLVDVRKQLARHAAPNPVYFHFAGIRSPWTRRALASVGFGSSENEAKPVFSVAYFETAAKIVNDKEAGSERNDVEAKFLPIQSVDRPSFNTDVGALPRLSTRPELR